MNHYRNNFGFSLIEVLVTIVILMIGLLGLAGLQARALTVQMESYQRAQALVLLKDMADRIDTNRKNAALYVTAAPLGTGGTCPAGASIVNADLCAWHNTLLGAAETLVGATTTNVGAMIGARGCIYQVVAPASGIAAQYSIVVAWQGLNNTAPPDISTATSAGNCGYHEYKDKNGNIIEELHRVVALPIAVADLQ